MLITSTKTLMAVQHTRGCFTSPMVEYNSRHQGMERVGVDILCLLPESGRETNMCIVD